MSAIIYGPVPSWRLGRSLGIDLLSTRGKTCSFDCIYCQLGKTVHPLVERKEFVTIPRLVSELERVRGIPADYATFSGVGEYVFGQWQIIHPILGAKHSKIALSKPIFSPKGNFLKCQNSRSSEEKSSIGENQ